MSEETECLLFKAGAAWEAEFPEPRTPDEAIGRKEALLMQIGAIQSQLGEHRRGNGQYADPKRFHDWRRRTRIALLIKQSQYRLIKRWLHQHQQVQFANDLLRKLYNLTTDWINRDKIVTTDPEEALLDQVEAALGVKDEEEQPQPEPAVAGN